MTDTATAGALWNQALAQVREEQAKRAVDAERQRVATDAEAIRDRCRTLTGFIRDAWHVLEPDTPYVHGWYIDAIAEHLEAVTRGEIPRLAINIPPAHAKSLITSVLWPAWEWGPVAATSRRWLTTSWNEKYVKRDCRKMRDLVESEWYRALWPVELIRAAELSFENSARGAREGVAFSGLTSGRGDRLVIDDPHSTEQAESPADRARTCRIFLESAPLRINDVQKSAIVVIMQRLHSNDVCGVIETRDLDYVRLILPLEFEPARRCQTCIGFQDPRTYDGELLFPERFPRAQVDQIKATMGSFAAAGQLQQRPVPREGGMFKREWFADKFIDAAPQGVVWVRHWDLAATKRSAIETTGARTAGVKMGRAPDGSIIVGDLKTAAEEGHRVRQLIKTVAETDGVGVEISLPQDPGQAGKAQASDYIAMLAGWNVHARPETGDKETRAEPFAAQCEGGNVYLLRGAWNSDWLDEVALFPGGPRKDVVDACSGAFGRLIKPVERNMEFAAPKFFTGD